MQSMVSRTKENPERETITEGLILDKYFSKIIGLVHEVTITAKKVGFRRHDWQKLAEDPDLFARVQRMVNCYRFTNGGWLPGVVLEARKILGSENVFTHYDVVAAWGGCETQMDREGIANLVFIPSWKEVLEACAEQNKTKRYDWKLVFTQGLSIKEQARQSSYHAYTFFGSAVGLDNAREVLDSPLPIFRKKTSAGYHLIDFSGFPKTLIDGILGEDRKIAHPATVLEALLTDNRLGSDAFYRLREHPFEQMGVGIEGNFPEGSSATMDSPYLHVTTRPDPARFVLVEIPFCSPRS